MAQKQSNRKSLRVPDLDADRQEILDFKDRWFSDHNIIRSRRLEQMAKNHFYTALGRQWLEIDRALLYQGSRGYAFKDVDSKQGLPRPVTNKIAPAVEVELTALNKRQLTPKVVPNSRDPRCEAAAKVAEDVLNHRLKETVWADKRSEVTYHTIVYGTGILKSYWDERYSKTVSTPSPDAVGCPQCGTMLSNPSVPMGDGLKHLDKATEDPNDPGTVNATMCPTCDDEVPLVPLQMTAEQAMGANDLLGRPFIVEAPMGNTDIEVVSPFDLFVLNSGVGVNHYDCQIIGQATVRSLDWIEERYPWAFSGDNAIEPEDPYELLRWHPVYGEWDYVGNYSSEIDSNIYDNHARVYELHAEKNFRFPEGRSIVIIGETVVYNGPLYRTVDGRSVATVKYAAAVFKLRPGEFFGRGLVDDLISPQNRLNGMDAQIIEARERLGAPNIIATESMDFHGPEYDERGGGAIWRWQPDPVAPNAKPEIFGDKLFNTAVYQERDRVSQDMKELAGPQDIELGEAPRNITTTSGLQLLGESAERRRSERERSLISAFEKIWVHQLELLNVLRREPDFYEKETEDGTWAALQFTAEDLRGQTKIKVEKQAEIDKSIWQREATREAQADGLIRPADPYSVRRILELRGLPTDVNQDQNFQVDTTKRQWTDFIDSGEIPVIDPTIDDPAIHFGGLSTFLLSEEGQRIQKAVGWPDILKKIAGWDTEIIKLEQLDAQSRALYGSPEGAEQKYAQLYAQYAQTQAASVSVSKAAGEAGMPAPQAPPLAPPPEPFFLPPDQADRVYQLWVQMIMKNTNPMEQPKDPMQMRALDSYLKFRAVVEGYRMLRDKKMMSMMAGVPSPGTPEGNPGIGNATQDLNVPQPQNPPNPNNPPNVGAA